MNRRTFLGTTAAALSACALGRSQTGPSPMILDADSFRSQVDFFNTMVEEDLINAIPNAQAWQWMKDNVPYFTCPDPDVERTYYYRWWTYRKHIKETRKGYIVTEFLRPVSHATEFNAISCALGHHVAEGRWIHDRKYIDQYVNFWLHSGENGGLQRGYHNYSNWTAVALYDRWRVDGNKDALLAQLDALQLDYTTWEQERLLPSGLFWQYDVRDGMEESASGSRRNKNARPSINSYMYGNAKTVAAIARMAGKSSVVSEYEARAERLRSLVQANLWNQQDQFFEALLDTGKLAGIREAIGFTPWFTELPEQGKGYEVAWKQMMDPQGFYAPYGPTTCEQRSPRYAISWVGDDCQWNGPNWAFATTIDLKSFANMLNSYKQSDVSVADYFKIFMTYTREQKRKTSDGRVIPWIDESQNPATGEWHTRAIKIKEGTFTARGDHYNHSGYCDLVISGVVGLRPRADETVEVNPLVPARTWDWFCLDNVSYHGKTLTIVWDRTGEKFGKGKGLRVFANGKQVAASESFGRVTGNLNA